METAVGAVVGGVGRDAALAEAAEADDELALGPVVDDVEAAREEEVACDADFDADLDAVSDVVFDADCDVDLDAVAVLDVHAVADIEGGCRPALLDPAITETWACVTTPESTFGSEKSLFPITGMFPEKFDMERSLDSCLEVPSAGATAARDSKGRGRGSGDDRGAPSPYQFAEIAELWGGGTA